MRFRLMATYRGVPYEAGVGPSSSEVVLFAACPPPEELGFDPAPGHWRKQVNRGEGDELWESRPVGRFHGDPCLVLDDLGDRLHIAYLGKDGRRARELGYWQVDRGVYELLTPRDEVTGLTEEKAEQGPPRRGPVNGAQQTPSYPYGSPPRPPPGAAAPRLHRAAGPARPGRRRRLRGQSRHGPGRRLERQWLPGRHRGLERQRDPARPARPGLERQWPSRRHRRVEPGRISCRHRRLEPGRIARRHRRLGPGRVAPRPRGRAPGGV